MLEPARFSDLTIHEALQRALAARGYDTATPVQAAVLDAAAAGRDLLVSSQTGSGKTIAFGAALTGTLLAPPKSEGEGEGKRPARVAGAPRALVIVPTRELVAQVREELGWLLAGTPLRLGSFTGGTAVGGDLRALHRGVDVAIGTPGRLVDLMRREKLVLGQVEVVVLDEADEMLDLGFREDLEILLGAAPVARRTLLLSATLPPEIRSLARRFQRDALAIDPRKAGQEPGAPNRAATGAHDDITYVAHLIAGGDRLAAVVNLLRASGDSRAIVFCTTRDAVGSLHRELVSRGFAATAISGERAQAERDRALDQVRQGEARILVATNVAARGLHLPDVDLIIHADLPLNAESLTHRSGRTGRAGRKGTAVVIASLAERRKAERLLAAAQVRVPWTAPPSAKQIAAAARARLLDSLLAESPAADESSEGGGGSAGGDAGDAGGMDDLLAPFAGKLSSDDLARRLLARELDRLPGGEPLLPVILPGADSDRRFGAAGNQAPPRRRAPGEIAREGVMFRVNLGGKDQADPRWLLPLICRRGGVTRREVGAIRIGPQETLFEIAGDAAADFALAASQRDPRAPHVRMEPVDGSGLPISASASASAPVSDDGFTGGGSFARLPRPPARREPPRNRPAGGPPRLGNRPLSGGEPSRGQTFGAPPIRPVLPASTNGAPSGLPAHDRPHQRRPPIDERPSPSDAAPSSNGVAMHSTKSQETKPQETKPHETKSQETKPHEMKRQETKPHETKPHVARPHVARPHDAKAHSAKPHVAKAHAPKSPEAKAHSAKPFQGKPYPAAKPFQDKPYDKPYPAGKPFQGKPYPAGKPFQGKPYPAAKPFQGKPYAGKPYAAKPHTGKPHPGKPHAAKGDHLGRPGGGKRKG